MTPEQIISKYPFLQGSLLSKLIGEPSTQTGNEYFYTKKKEIYELMEEQPNYLILRDLSKDHYLVVLKDDFHRKGGCISWTSAEPFETLEKAEYYASQSYDRDYTKRCEALKEKIAHEYVDIKARIAELSIDNILAQINQIHAIESVKRVFDSESGIFMAKATLDYLLDQDTVALEALAKRMAAEDTIEFQTENLNAAAEDIQYEIENEELGQESCEPEMEL